MTSIALCDEVIHDSRIPEVNVVYHCIIRASLNLIDPPFIDTDISIAVQSLADQCSVDRADVFG